MKRREFIIGAASIAAISIPSVYYYFNLGDADYNPLIAEPQSLSLIWDTETITSIGSKYLQQYPDENNKQTLVKKIVKNISGSDEVVIQKLNKQIKKDFEIGNTVLIDGWILSKTEARQCALLTTQQ
ncbi:MAG: hypothetical protein OEW67_14675 [Cyclobacteriaceae bacterium]|nr:hypothetical protein [Cyclobacteriaceae bacterium]